MTFFDNKEDVIQIELTPHGRKLLSKGKLKPSFYTFHDDDILYESEFGGFTENNNAIKARILEETPYMKTRNCFDGVDSNIYNMNILDDSRALKNEIGSMPLNTNKTPSWKINFLQGELSSSQSYMSSSKNNIQPIPQLECEIEYTMSADNVQFYENIPSYDDTYISDIRTDGSFVSIKQEHLLLDILEKNGFDYKDSFEMEVYIYDYDGTQNRSSACSSSNDEYTLRRLNFLRENKRIRNDMLMIPREDGLIDDLDVLELSDQTHVEHFLDISIDKEIPEFEICKSVHDLKKRNIYLDTDIDCSQYQTESNLDIDIYGSPVTDIEDCD